MTPLATAAGAATPSGRARASRSRASAGRARAVVLLLATCAVAAGCGVRLETPPPAEPSPDTVEVLRARAVDDALQVADLVADVTPTVTDPATLAVLDEAGSFATRHVEELGGVYDSGLPEPSTAAEPDVTVTTQDDAGAGDDAEDAGSGDDPAGDGTTDATPDDPAAPPTTADVVTALVGAAQRTSASADVSPDPALARLLASVAVSENLSAQRLAAVTGSDAAAGLTTTAAPVEEAPNGVGAADLATLVEAEDSAGYAYEVRAAQSEGDVRGAAVARAAVHRARAQSWALAAGTDGTSQDPRRAAYALPDDADTPTLARRVESGLAQSYASLVATAAASSRAAAIALLTDSWAGAVAWGETPVAFPGLPEQAAG